jgi:proteasome activator subunit 4
MTDVILEADLSDWAPLTDPEKLDVKWHVPSDGETKSAIAIYKMATEFQLNRIDELLNDEQKRSLPDWTDELRQCLKYIVNALLASATLYHRLPPPDEWEVTREELPSATTEEIDDMDVDSPDVIEDECGEEDDDDETDGDDEGAGRSQKYVDGYNNRPLTSEQVALLKSIYQRIGMVLLDLSRYLKNNRKDDYHAFIEISTVLPSF